ncbi:helix-turn-helix transcriptional regulator [Nocardiopsis ganjiahuensis]|uniref:helix-turn-helix transcriptional regulator n=1 Tax=Nocardiopsis ganjiahuensis TaxID=239984 RepID=UPI000348BADC|nr:AAA family ATPase [Nocardiopsis ganjiahuensis]
MSPSEPVSLFVGRRPQLEHLLSEAAAVGSGSARTSLVVGEAGIGKTRLISEYLSRTPLARTVVGGCLEMGTEGIAFAPFAAVLRQLVRDTEAPVAGGELARLVPGLGPVPETTEESRARLFEAVLTFLEERARPGGLALVIEDLHWSDASTRDLLVFLLRNLGTTPVHLVVSVRSDDLHRAHPLRRLLPELERLPGAGRVDLAPLTPEEVAEQATVLGHPVDPDLLHARSGGNPLFVESLLADPAPLGTALPDTPRELLLRAVEPLPEDTRTVLGLASASGDRVDHTLLAEVAAGFGIGDVDLDRALRPAVDARVLRATGTGYVFRHALLAEAVYSELLPGERVRTHRRYVEALDRNGPGRIPGETAAQLARHAHIVHDHPRALNAAWVAVEHAEASAAHPELLELLERVLELWEVVPDAEEILGLPHGELLRRACHAAHVYGGVRRAAAHAAAGLRVTDPATHPDLTGELFMARGRARSDEGRADALEDLRAAAEYLGHDHPRRPALDAVSAIVLMRLGRDDEAEWAARVAVASAQRIGDEASEVEALMTLANLLGEPQAIEDDPTGQRQSTGRRRSGDSEGEAVIAMLHRAIDLARRTGQVRMEIRAWRNLAAHLDHQLRMEEAYRAAERGWERCAELGISRSQGLGCGLAMVGLLANMGRFDEAEALLAGLPRGESRQAAHRLDTEALHHTFQGRWEQAEEALSDFVRIMPREVSSPLEYLNHYYARLYLLMYRGELVEAALAVEHAHRDIGMLEPGRFPYSGLSVVGELVFRLRVRGGGEELRRAEALTALLRANLDHYRGRVSPLDRLGRRVIRGFLAEDPLEALELFSEVALVAEASLNHGILLQALTGSFHSALRWGDPARARALLERFESLERESREWVLRRQAGEMRAALRAAAPDPAALPAGLTPRELEVLHEVAKGSSNREVGRALFISAKTVSVHLSNLMAKLGADNRTAAVARARELGLV